MYSSDFVLHSFQHEINDSLSTGILLKKNKTIKCSSSCLHHQPGIEVGFNRNTSNFLAYLVLPLRVHSFLILFLDYLAT